MFILEAVEIGADRNAAVSVEPDAAAAGPCTGGGVCA